jgi:hypothetical protein
MGLCKADEIIPREAVVRSKLDETNCWLKDDRRKPPRIEAWDQLKMSFEQFVHTAAIELKICVVVGAKPQVGCCAWFLLICCCSASSGPRPRPRASNAPTTCGRSSGCKMRR